LTIEVFVSIAQDNINALDSAIASGARSVTIGGQTITYNTTASLLTARAHFARIVADENVASTGKRRSKQRLAYYVGRD
jgi:hypothetical protein